MEPILTDDGSYTLLHPDLGETYHAHQGAASEAEAKFLLPTRFREHLQNGPVRLLDIGFGLGINCRAALSCDAPHGLHIDTIEWEAEALDRGLLLQPGDPLLVDLKASGRSRNVQLHLGDLRTVLPKLEGQYDVIFHDPFSPLKNTEAWSVEVFHLLRERITATGLLATYSDSTIVRKGMSEAGWYLENSPAHPPHRGGTLASPDPKALKTPLLPEMFLGEPFRDPDLCWEGKRIRSERETIVRSSRS